MVADANTRAQWASIAATRWPEVRASQSEFLASLDERFEDQQAVDSLAPTGIEGLWLAWACVQRDRGALAIFEQQYMLGMAAVLGRMRFAAAQVDDLLQDIRSRLLVGDGRPRLLDYSGRADLRTWLRTVTTRYGIDELRKAQPLNENEEDALALPALDDDPELRVMKERYREEFRGAVSEALASLSSRDKLLLKLTYVDGQSIDRLCAIYQVHRATAARWIGAARDRLTDETRNILIAKLGIPRSEVSALGRMVVSQLELSMNRLLA